MWFCFCTYSKISVNLSLHACAKEGEFCSSQTPRWNLTALACMHLFPVMFACVKSCLLVIICGYQCSSVSWKFSISPCVKSYSGAFHAFISTNQIKFIVPHCSSVLTGRDMIKNGLHLSLLSHSFSFTKYDPSFLGKWDLEEQTRMHRNFLPLLHCWTPSPCVSFIYNDFVNSVTERSPLSPHSYPVSHSLSLTQSSGF